MIIEFDIFENGMNFGDEEHPLIIRPESLITIPDPLILEVDASIIHYWVGKLLEFSDLEDKSEGQPLVRLKVECRPGDQLREDAFEFLHLKGLVKFAPVITLQESNEAGLITRARLHSIKLLTPTIHKTDQSFKEEFRQFSLERSIQRLSEVSGIEWDSDISKPFSETA